MHGVLRRASAFMLGKIAAAPSRAGRGQAWALFVCEGLVGAVACSGCRMVQVSACANITRLRMLLGAGALRLTPSVAAAHCACI